jgi:hypothetical protein
LGGQQTAFSGAFRVQVLERRVAAKGMPQARRKGRRRCQGICEAHEPSRYITKTAAALRIKIRELWVFTAMLL